ncbi:DnaJ protein, putative [Hepatocystis sp. ex Piliocolobus tephrosceles]|uniref:DnaJ homolog subfamily C member 25 n=1 Tax=Piliocolobus tephrosceles TaxID=591936 RepID=A0A8C9HIX3_9PRIM|nr:DnaJ protein, putative [Hepatocystis sp. ex Piliocolobus tephrosceles]
MKIFSFLFPFVVLFISFNNVNCLFDDVLSRFYCNNENCYEILGAKRSATNEEIRNLFFMKKRMFSNHPDPELRKKLIKAYTVLSNKLTRRYYDYYLNNPHSIFNIIHFNIYYIYKIIKIIIALTIVMFILSLFNYMYKKYEIKKVLIALRKNKHFNKQVQSTILSKHPNYRTYDTIERTKIHDEIELEVADSFSPITNSMNLKISLLNDFIIFKLFFLLKQIYLYINWYILWIINYNILNKEYTEDDKIYITRTCVRLSAQKWNVLSNEEKNILMKKQLWIKQNRKEFLNELKEKEKINKMSRAKYKKQIRMKKKGISFNYND